MTVFSIDDTAVILIDHQVGTNTWASTTPLALLQRNVIILAKFAKGTGIPVVLTSSQETNVNVQGPLMPELQETLPEAFEARIKRQGVVNAWDDPAFAEACRSTQRKNFVMAGVTTDVCMVAPEVGDFYWTTTAQTSLATDGGPGEPGPSRRQPSPGPGRLHWRASGPSGNHRTLTPPAFPCRSGTASPAICLVVPSPSLRPLAGIPHAAAPCR